MTLGEKGEHPAQYHPLTEAVLELRISCKCSCCGMKVPLGVMREQGLKNWRYAGFLPGIFCPGCSHVLGLDKQL